MSARTLQFGEVQQRFVDALLNRRNEAGIVTLINGDPAVASRRLAFYRGSLTGHWNAALSSAYPVIRELVGEDCFFGLSRAYGKWAPSASGDLNQCGYRFADFLAQFEPSQAYRYFPDVARIEWAAHLAYYAADGVPLTPELLAQFDGEAVEGLHLCLRASAALIETNWDAANIWRLHKEGRGNSFEGAREGRMFALVIRRSWAAEVHDLSPGAFAALRSVQNGLPLGKALLCALDVEPGIDLVEVLGTWFSLEIFQVHPGAIGRGFESLWTKK